MLTLKERIEKEISLAYKKLALVEKHPDMTECDGRLRARSALQWCGLFRLVERSVGLEVIPYYLPDPELPVESETVVIRRYYFDDTAEYEWRHYMLRSGYDPGLVQKIVEAVYPVVQPVEEK